VSNLFKRDPTGDMAAMPLASSTHANRPEGHPRIVRPAPKSLQVGGAQINLFRSAASRHRDHGQPAHSGGGVRVGMPSCDHGA
jgi:hypothetical protein